jgi:hypothetical protein
MKIEPAGDYAELIPDPTDEGVNPLRLCPKCSAYKPPSHFRERLTKLQARKQGYAGTHAVEIERSMCAPCQPNRKPFNYKSGKEIANAVYYGVISTYEADELRKKRAAARSRNGTDNIRIHHHAKRKALWQPVRAAIRKDYGWASSLMGLLKRTGRQETALYVFVERYRNVLLKHISYKAWAVMRTGPNYNIPAPPSKLSELLADLPEPVGNLREIWFEQIPYAQTERIKAPALVREALGGTYVPPEE